MSEPKPPHWETVPTLADRYVYRIRKTAFGSARFGVCEICGKHVSETFYQVEGLTFECEGQILVTQAECRNLFGHEKCLREARRG